MNDLWSKYFVLYELIEISLYYSGDIHWIVPNIQFFPWNITRYCAYIHRVKITGYKKAMLSSIKYCLRLKHLFILHNTMYHPSTEGGFF